MPFPLSHFLPSIYTCPFRGMPRRERLLWVFSATLYSNVSPYTIVFTCCFKKPEVDLLKKNRAYRNGLLFLLCLSPTQFNELSHLQSNVPTKTGLIKEWECWQEKPLVPSLRSPPTLTELWTNWVTLGLSPSRLSPCSFLKWRNAITWFLDGL